MATTTENNNNNEQTLPESISQQNEIVTNALKELEASVKALQNEFNDRLKTILSAHKASVSEANALGKKNVALAKKGKGKRQKDPNAPKAPPTFHALTPEGVKVATDIISVIDKWVTERTKKKDIKDDALQAGYDKIVGETLPHLKEAVEKKAMPRTWLQGVYIALGYATNSFAKKDNGEQLKSEVVINHPILKTIANDKDLKQTKMMSLSSKERFGRFFVESEASKASKADPKGKAAEPAAEPKKVNINKRATKAK